MCFVANLLCYNIAKYFKDRSTALGIIAKTKRFCLFETQCICSTLFRHSVTAGKNSKQTNKERKLDTNTVEIKSYIQQVVQQQTLGELATRTVIRWPAVSAIFIPKTIENWSSFFKLQSIMSGIRVSGTQ